jgi:hypothetical protein
MSERLAGFDENLAAPWKAVGITNAAHAFNAPEASRKRA